LIGKPEEKSPLERPRHRWEDDIKIYQKESGMDWIYVVQNKAQLWALVNMIMNHRVLLNAMNFLTS
jgi:hypothetical protein